MARKNKILTNSCKELDTNVLLSAIQNIGKDITSLRSDITSIASRVDALENNNSNNVRVVKETSLTKVKEESQIYKFDKIKINLKKIDFSKVNYESSPTTFVIKNSVQFSSIDEKIKEAIKDLIASKQEAENFFYFNDIKIKENASKYYTLLRECKYLASAILLKIANAKPSLKIDITNLFLNIKSVYNAFEKRRIILRATPLKREDIETIQSFYKSI